MAKNVQFYRLGFENPVKLATYESYKVNDGRIVFARVQNLEDENNPHLYIYANGVEYHVDLCAAEFLKIVDNDQSNVKVASANGKLTFNADLNISGYMIDVYKLGEEPDIKYYYDDPETGETIEVTDVETVYEHGEGKYLKLKLGDDVVYIWSGDLISLDDYVKKEDLNSSLSDLENELIDYIDGSINAVNDKIDDLSTSIHEYIEEEIEPLVDRITEVSAALDEYIDATDKKLDEVDASIDRLDSSVENLQDELERQDEVIDEIVEKVADLSTAIDDISTKLEEGVVSSVDSENEFINVTPNQGDVKIDLEVVKATDDSSFPSRGLVTDGYVEEKLDKFNWIEIEEAEDPTPQEDPAGGNVQQSNAPIQTTMNLTEENSPLAIISTGGDVTIE